MEFTLAGERLQLDADTVRSAVRPVPPDPIQAPWVEIDGARWPVKQALRLALLANHPPFTAHEAVTIMRRLGFATSPLPRERADASAAAPATPPVEGRVPADAARAASAFERVDDFFSSGSLTVMIRELEARLAGAGREEALAASVDVGLDERLVEAALVMRERVGMLDSLIHAAVITQVLPLILEHGETVRERPSLGAGNDPLRPYDLSTSLRVAEFKVSLWKGADSMRERGLFADVVGLSLDDSGRRREMYVVGDRPMRFLRNSRADVTKKLSKSALRVRDAPGLRAGMSVSEFMDEHNIRVYDLRDFLPGLG